MMKTRVLAVLKYTVSLAFAAGLMYFIFNYYNIDVAELIGQLDQVKYEWVIASLLVSVFSHIARAYRWNIMLRPLGYKDLDLFRTSLAVLFSYFVNFFLPRMGEIAKCGLLKRTNNVELSSSFGTVVAERIFDLIMLAVVGVVALIVAYDKLHDFFGDFLMGKLSTLQSTKLWILGGLAFLTVLFTILLYRKFKNKILNSGFGKKVKEVLIKLMEGLTSIRKIDNLAGFIGSTLAIWVLYYLSTYFMMFAVSETSNLGLSAAMAVLLMGTLGMAAPVQGGIGTFHLFVGNVLLLYGISKQQGIFFATLMHTSQMIFLIILGVISFYLGVFVSRKTKTSENITEDPVS